MARLIAIGDIHGCSAALEALIEAISPRPGDRLVTLGDYVDRGKDSRGVIDRLIDLDRQNLLVPLLGNHEEMMLGAIRGSYPMGMWLEHGGRETLESYGSDLEEIPEEHLEFLDRCKAFYEADEEFFVHANYVADEPLHCQPAEALRWQNLLAYFPERHNSGKRAIAGHTAQREGEILDAGHLVCIDTYCYGGGWLTAYEPLSGQIWQASASGNLRSN